MMKLFLSPFPYLHAGQLMTIQKVCLETNLFHHICKCRSNECNLTFACNYSKATGSRNISLLIDSSTFAFLLVEVSLIRFVNLQAHSQCEKRIFYH